MRLLGAGALLVPAARAEAQIPVGPQFQVSAYTTGDQGSVTVAADDSGGFVIAWSSPDGDSSGVFARRYLPTGAPADASEFRVNAHTTGIQDYPAVASDPGGNLVVVWSSSSQDGSTDGIFGRRYDAAGVTGPEFQVNSYTTNAQTRPAVAMAADGRFVVAWRSHGPGDLGEIRAQRYDAAGNRQGSEIQVNASTAGDQVSPAIAVGDAGDFVVVWISPDSTDLFARRFTAVGTPLGPDFEVNTFTVSGLPKASVALDTDGSFLVVWTSTRPTDFRTVAGRRFNGQGQPLTNEFLVNSHTTGSQELPSVAMAAGGTAFAAWVDPSLDGDNGIAARALEPGGPRGPDFVVNSYTTGIQWGPAVTGLGSGRFVFVWTGDGPGGNGTYARRFASDLIFQDGFESGDMSRWSASQTDGGDLAVSGPAALKMTSAGLRGTVDDTAGLYVQDDSPDDEQTYRARFYFDTGDFDPGESLNKRRVRLFLAFEEAPTRRVMAIVLRRLNGEYSLMGRARLDDDSQHDTGFKPIDPGPHFVEVHWRRASGPDANNGTLEMWIDGLFAHTFWNLDNSLSAIDFVRLGALSVKAGASGTLVWDEFESRRDDFVGP